MCVCVCVCMYVSFCRLVKTHTYMHSKRKKSTVWPSFSMHTHTFGPTWWSWNWRVSIVESNPLLFFHYHLLVTLRVCRVMARWWFSLGCLSNLGSALNRGMKTNPSEWDTTKSKEILIPRTQPQPPPPTHSQDGNDTGVAGHIVQTGWGDSKPSAGPAAEGDSDPATRRRDSAASVPPWPVQKCPSLQWPAICLSSQTEHHSRALRTWTWTFTSRTWTSKGQSSGYLCRATRLEIIARH